jgi:hypothetical protein
MFFRNRCRPWCNFALTRYNSISWIAAFSSGQCLSDVVRWVYLITKRTPRFGLTFRDVIYALWQGIFMGTNICLFVILPFAYFYHETEDFHFGTSFDGAEVHFAYKFRSALINLMLLGYDCSLLFILNFL